MESQVSLEYLLLLSGMVLMALAIVGSVLGIGGYASSVGSAYNKVTGVIIP